MRLLVFILFLFSVFPLSAQRIANCIEIVGPDSMRFYYKGGLCDEECSKASRLAKMSHDGYYYNGSSKDFYENGQLAVDCYYDNNVLHGAYASFYPDGKQKEKGQYEHGQKTGEWKLWYDNGRLWKVMVFDNQGYHVMQFFRRSGHQLVENGNGTYNDIDLIPGAHIKGEIKNGKQHGQWTISNLQIGDLLVGRETFIDGKFILGETISLSKVVEKNYFDYSKATIDVTHDRLPVPASVSDCKGYWGRYNSKRSDLPFYDYLYQNFDPGTLSKGYIIAGFTINKKGEMDSLSIYSTLDNKAAEKQLISVFKSAGKWEQSDNRKGRTYSRKLFVFQFYGGRYKILGHAGNMRAPVEYSAQFRDGEDAFVNSIQDKNGLPETFFTTGVNLATSISFHVDENGNCIDTNGPQHFKDRTGITDEEPTLYRAVFKKIQQTSKQWKPATTSNMPVKQYYYGIFTIRDGVPKFRLISENWVLYP